MKNRTKFLGGLTLLGAGIVALAGCQGGSTGGSTGSNGGDTPTKTAAEIAVEDAMTLTRDELFAKAAKELGTTGKLKFIATTSRGGKAAAKNKFISELQKHNKDIVDPLDYSSTVDGRIYTMLNAEYDNGTKDGYSGAILQDGYQLQTKAINKGSTINYIPKEWKEAEGVNVERDGKPFALQYNFKTWMENTKTHAPQVDNIWDVTQAKYVKKLQTMDPTSENVNMDWLMMLTTDSENAKLKAAFEDPTNDNKNFDFSPYEKYGEKKYAYGFIASFIKNAVFNKDDGEAINNLAKGEDNIGWIVYSKLMNVTETADVSKKYITISALGNDNTDGSTKGDSSIKGFAGFMYKHYPVVTKNAQYPYATCAFINILSTTKEGYSVWANDVGDYPTMPSINKDRSKLGQNEDETKSMPGLNDPSSEWWTTKGAAVVEDPAQISSAYAKTINFIFAQIAAKK